jgi:carbon monoxide dehydrogenase subunit G
MKLQKEFAVARPRAAVAEALEDDGILEKLFPGTRIEHPRDGVRETFTPFSALGSSREIRFLFQTLPDGNMRFEKVCDGNVWRFLEGRIQLDEVDERMTRVGISMTGQTRAFVPDITIRAPMRSQIEDMARVLRAELERK